MAVTAPAGVPSPCINICRMDTARLYCQGCLRTIDEIRDWAVLDDDEKRVIWQVLAQRRLDLPTEPVKTST